METEAEKAQLTTLLAKVRGEPEKMKKQADIAATAATSHQSQADKNDDEIRSYDNSLNEQVSQPAERHNLLTLLRSSARPFFVRPALLISSVQTYLVAPWRCLVCRQERDFDRRHTLLPTLRRSGAKSSRR